jgi:hypothetical protein
MYFIYVTVTIVDNIHHAVFCLKRLRNQPSSVCWAQLCMLYVKTETEYSLGNIVSGV